MAGLGGLKWKSESGCCICGNKTSSSRFTSSLKYEPEFAGCFLLKEKRSGEICNPCVLNIKRYRSFPPGTRNWGHVVDSRKGPGNKSATMRRSRSKLIKKSENKSSESMKILTNVNSHCKGTSRRSMIKNKNPMKLSQDLCNPQYWTSFLTPSHLNNQPENKPPKKCMIKRFPPKSPRFLNSKSFMKQNICCQTVYISRDGMIILDKMNKWCERIEEKENDDEPTERHAPVRPRSLIMEPLGVDLMSKEFYLTSHDSPLDYSSESKDKAMDIVTIHKESSIECDASSGYSSIVNSPEPEMEDNKSYQF